MKLSVFLLSHNKNGYVQEAVQSVLDQDYDDFELWIIENSTDTSTRNALWNFLTARADSECCVDPRVKWCEELVPADVRLGKYVPSWLLNKYYPQATGDVILYLSDDDLFVPGLFSAVDEAFTDHPDWSALYFTLTRVNAQAPGIPEAAFSAIEATVPRGAGQVDCCIDGGQVAYRRGVLDSIGQPYFNDNLGLASHADGVHLDRITGVTVFQPLPVHGVIHRHTPLSTWTKN